MDLIFRSITPTIHADDPTQVRREPGVITMAVTDMTGGIVLRLFLLPVCVDTCGVTCLFAFVLVSHGVTAVTDMTGGSPAISEATS